MKKVRKRITLAAAGAALSVVTVLPGADGAYASTSDSPSASATPSATPSYDDNTVYTDPVPTATDSDQTEFAGDPDATPTATENPNMNHPGGEICDNPGAKYVAKSKAGEYISAIGPSNSNYNGTSRDMDMTFTAQASGTVGVSLSAELETSVSFMVAAEKAKFGGTLSVSLTAGLTNSVHPTAAPHTRITATYGVWRQKIFGETYHLYSNCRISNDHAITSYTPLRVGWYVKASKS
ncbi:hypothetical protein O1M63_11660 [Streptomyces mirabilis]|uniref:hypothetical protein n=1 Tax=Streptomyces TaxID=1883 RepID=UPI001163157C|nr:MULTISPECIES: hypothetical protein [Streptomyces]MCX4608282.1 hypothetical protein [Streptomyces mirabilis]MCX5348747.1 hypothetical protein [Streptomyces mirabilis]MCZ0998660.1 hypothetical protein [Streptomyces mirabilis]QDN87312.1 hypothetical protein FNV61_18205 [Streptomyces sp. RLB3-6]QDO08125.1 hypothetical protein FNV68_19300 [Streptomyces sp. S1D4-23]